MSTTFLSQFIRPTTSIASISTHICKTCQRNAATYRRTRKALRVKLSPAFAPSQTETQDHITYNPPSSAPSVYHTPPVFLPENDPRRALHTFTQKQRTTTAPQPHSQSPSSSSSPQQQTKPSTLATLAAHRLRTSPSATTLPPIRPQYERKYHLTQSDIDEIRRLRTEDPTTWTRNALAEKFGCSQFFVSLCVKSPEAAERAEKRTKEAVGRWGARRRGARESRAVRKGLWGIET